MTTLRETIANPIVEDMDNLRHMLGVQDSSPSFAKGSSHERVAEVHH